MTAAGAGSESLSSLKVEAQSHWDTEAAGRLKAALNKAGATESMVLQIGSLVETGGSHTDILNAATRNAGSTANGLGRNDVVNIAAITAAEAARQPSQPNLRMGELTTDGGEMFILPTNKKNVVHREPAPSGPPRQYSTAEEANNAVVPGDTESPKQQTMAGVVMSPEQRAILNAAANARREKEAKQKEAQKEESPPSPEAAEPSNLQQVETAVAEGLTDYLFAYNNPQGLDRDMIAQQVQNATKTGNWQGIVRALPQEHQQFVLDIIGQATTNFDQAPMQSLKAALPDTLAGEDGASFTNEQIQQLIDKNVAFGFVPNFPRPVKSMISAFRRSASSKT